MVRPLMTWSLGASTAGLAGLLVAIQGCAHGALDRADSNAARIARSDEALTRLTDAYARGFLLRNPVVSSYLGASGRFPELVEAEGQLRDHSPEAIAEEDRWLRSIEVQLDAFAPEQLSRDRRIDRDVALSQVRFLLRQHEVRRYQERALDTYNEEPFRGLDFQLQGLTHLPDGRAGTREEWERIILRVSAIPKFLETARAQIFRGVERGCLPDIRMVESDGLEGAEANAKYFDATLVSLADGLMSGAWKVDLLARLGGAASRAALAYRAYRSALEAAFFVEKSGKRVPMAELVGDRFAIGETEYDWALKNNLKVSKSAAELYAASWPAIARTREEMVALARTILASRGESIDGEESAIVRRVLSALAKAHPKSDAEMLDWYRASASRLVDYGRRTGLFDVPADYRLEIVEMPGPLGAAPGGAAYYPAPPLKNTGVGRFYLSPTGNDPELLARISRDSVATLAAHEGFPGHDWNYKIMARLRSAIPVVRWLTPGAVEDSSSMWQDSLATEGWALYAEALLAEPRDGAPTGLYTPAERLFQLQSRLFREIRVAVDIGIHTGRMHYPEAVDRMSELFDFLPGSCSDAGASEDKRGSCRESERQIFRYSKWPTQAITYHLGKEAIVELRDAARRRLKTRFSEKQFHLAFMQQGAIPPGYFGEALLFELGATRRPEPVARQGAR